MELGGSNFTIENLTNWTSGRRSGLTATVGVRHDGDSMYSRNDIMKMTEGLSQPRRAQRERTTRWSMAFWTRKRTLVTHGL